MLLQGNVMCPHLRQHNPKQHETTRKRRKNDAKMTQNNAIIRPFLGAPPFWVLEYGNPKSQTTIIYHMNIGFRSITNFTQIIY